MPSQPTENLESNHLRDVVVKIYGMDSHFHQFSQHTTARNLSLRAALLENVRHHPDPGEVLGIDYKGKRARGRVLWVCEVESNTATQVGIEILADDECPWKDDIGIDPDGRYDGKDRRKHERIAACIGVDLQQSDSPLTMRSRSLDVSAGGCYVETSLTMPVGTKLKIGLWLDSERVSATAVVRTSDPGFGMGIEFIGMDSREESRLREFLQPFLAPAAQNITVH